MMVSIGDSRSRRPIAMTSPKTKRTNFRWPWREAVSFCEQARSWRPRGAGGWGIRNRKDRANAGLSCRNSAGRAVGGSRAVLWFR